MPNSRRLVADSGSDYSELVSDRSQICHQPIVDKMIAKSVATDQSLVGDTNRGKIVAMVAEVTKKNSQQRSRRSCDLCEARA